MLRPWCSVIVCAALAVCAPAAGGEQTTLRGLFIGTRAHRIELTLFAEPADGRRLHMTKGTLENVPAIRPTAGLRVFCAMPNWQPSGMILGTAATFNQDNAETRTLPFATRRINVFASEVRIADLEDPSALARLVANVHGSKENATYLFVVMFSSGLVRYYPVRLIR